jgi:2,3-bisphosphoglycerate-independent phosphoglycerate mutase
MMAHVLFLFLDGVGLNGAHPEHNPFAAAQMPYLESLLDGRQLLRTTAPYDGQMTSLRAIDARLGIEGLPQSATGQASLLTGRNVAAEIGGHYGPKPNPPIAAILEQENLFSMVKRLGGEAALLNAYPPRYFASIHSGHRLHAAIPFAVTSAGIPLRTAEDLQAGLGISADFTGAGWVEQPGFPPAPVYTSAEAGTLVAKLAQQVDFAWFEYWLTDYAGHRGSLQQAITLLEGFDEVLRSIVKSWDTAKDLVVISSDHGNLEDLSVRGHTLNPVPALLIGPETLRVEFASSLDDLTDFAPAILRTLSTH